MSPGLRREVSLLIAVADALHTLWAFEDDAPPIAWRGVAVFTGLQLVVAGSVEFWLEQLGFPHRTQSRAESFTLFVGTFAANALVALRGDRWAAYRRALERMPDACRRRSTWCARGALVLAFVFAAGTFAYMGHVACERWGRC